MRRAIEICRAGQGRVEPNPMVGCVLVQDGHVIGEGFHQEFGGPHAEVNAIRSVTADTDGATAYVTLEPCSHHGKTPPCSQALIAAKVKRVVVATLDPNPLVSGRGVQQLRDAGIEVDIGLLEQEAKQTLAPYLKRVTTGLPWVIAKYAMTLDGKIATESGDSKWISSEASRELVHRLRGRVDGILVGINTALEDDPLLTARPVGDRVARRWVADSQLRLDENSQLVATAKQFPLDLVTSTTADPDKIKRLESKGVNVFRSTRETASQRLSEFLQQQVIQHQSTNVLVEGGGQLLGSLRDLDMIDELHVFLGPRMIGGFNSRPPVTGVGVELIANGTEFQIASCQIIGGDVYVRAQRKPA